MHEGTSPGEQMKEANVSIAAQGWAFAHGAVITSPKYAVMP